MLSSRLIVSVFALAAVAATQATPITISSTGDGLSAGAQDLNWSVGGNPSYVSEAHSAWTGGTPILATGARWINLTGNLDSVPGGTYTFEQAFDLTGLDETTASLDVLWSSDNGSRLYLNGVQVGTLLGESAGVRSYQTSASVSLTSGFVSGINTLTFVVANGDDDVPNSPGPIGLIASVSGSAEAVPEPASMAVLGLGAAAFIRRRTRK